MVVERSPISKISQLPWTDRARLALAVILVGIVVGHALWPEAVTIDQAGTGLLILAAVVVLAPLLASAELLGNTFKFKDKWDEANDIEKRLPGPSADEVQPPGLAPPELWQPAFIVVDDEIRSEVKAQPLAVLGALRVEVRSSLVRVARALGIHTSGNKDTPELAAAIASTVHVISDDQVSLLNVAVELIDGLLLSGAATADDANRVLALLDTLNQSFSIGYAPNFDPNPDWDEQGRMCEYEHCIELMPLVGPDRASHEKWRADVRSRILAGEYDNDPDGKAQLQSRVEADDSLDYPEVADYSSSCPMFGHNCPGGPDVIASCEAAIEWTAELKSRGLSGRGDGDDASGPAPDPDLK